jgi:hypothetical protein
MKPRASGILGVRGVLLEVEVEAVTFAGILALS